jgi:hypothetical protein
MQQPGTGYAVNTARCTSAVESCNTAQAASCTTFHVAQLTASKYGSPAVELLTSAPGPSAVPGPCVPEAACGCWHRHAHIVLWTSSMQLNFHAASAGVMLQ